MNRIFGIILLLFFIAAEQPCEAKIFGKKSKVQSITVEDKKEVTPQLEAGAVVNDASNEIDKEDVDLQEIDDSLPENEDLIDKNDENDFKKTGTAKEEGLFKRIFDVESNIEAEFSLFDNFDLDKNDDNKIDEDTLLYKIINRDIIRTDIPSYLLSNELTFKPQKGIVSKVQYYGAFQGDLSSGWNAGDYDTNYDIGFLQFGAIGKFRNSKNDFKILINPRPSSERNYMQNFFADAYIINSSIPHHKVVVGYSRNQIGKEGGSSSYILPFVTRSQIARNFGSTRALGVRLIGNYSLVDYNLAFNSSDRYFHTPFAGPEFLAI